MSIVDKFIQAKHPELLNRSVVLNPIAKFFDIDHSLYRNRKLLCDMINTKATYNSIDPVTLEDINALPHDDIVSWWQHTRRYTARKSSMSMIMQSGQTMNPWVIDSASGVQQATNPEEYDRKYNLIHVKVLRDIKCNMCIDTHDVPHDVVMFFDFQSMCGDLYVTSLGTSLQSNVLEESSRGVNAVLDGLYATSLQYLMIMDTHTVHLIDCVMRAIQNNYLDSTKPPLEYIMHICKLLKETAPRMGEIIVHSVFMHASSIA
jgi:hypothetical protein